MPYSLKRNPQIDFSRGASAKTLLEALISALASKKIIGSRLGPIEIKEASERPLSSVLSIIRRSNLSTYVKSSAAKVFTELGEAEASAHKVALARVHFHEVGSRKNILAVLGVFIAIEQLGIHKRAIACSPLNLGGGTVDFSHGTFRVPTPATRFLVRSLPHFSNGDRELTTPTGAALAKVVCSSFTGPQPKSTHQSARKPFVCVSLS